MSTVVRSSGPDDLAAWSRRLAGAMGLPNATSYERLRIHRDGREALDALCELIEGATETLDLALASDGVDIAAAYADGTPMDPAAADTSVLAEEQVHAQNAKASEGRDTSLAKLLAKGQTWTVTGTAQDPI